MTFNEAWSLCFHIHNSAMNIGFERDRLKHLDRGTRKGRESAAKIDQMEQQAFEELRNAAAKIAGGKYTDKGFVPNQEAGNG